MVQFVNDEYDEKVVNELITRCETLNTSIEALNTSIKEILKQPDDQIVSGENLMIRTPQPGGKRSRRYKKSSKRIMRRRRGRTYRRK
jgi:hypothetical protein